MNIREIPLEKIIEAHPECLSEPKKLKYILNDLYPGIGKGAIYVIFTIADTGIAENIKAIESIDLIDKNRTFWVRKLKDDWCMSGTTVESCLDLWMDTIKRMKQKENKIYVWHKQLGYGKVENKNHLISVKFDSCPYKLFTYRKDDLNMLLRVVDENEYLNHGNKNIVLNNDIKKTKEEEYEDYLPDDDDDF